MLDRLTIHRFRGVRDLSIPFEGKNVAIFGPNGSGKSSVADAIDFLLTGRLRRLSGEGAGALSLGKHGPHIDAEPNDSWVEGEFKNARGDAVILRRDVDRPGDLKVTGEIPREVQRLLRLADVENHQMLTRREILRYIFTEPGKRAEQVGSLLQLTRIENIRKAVQGAAKDAVGVLRDQTAVANGRLQSVLRSVKPTAPDLADARVRVNAHRQTLGGAPIDSLKAGKIRAGLIAPAEAGAHPLQAQRTRELLDQALRWFEVEGGAIVERIYSYNSTIDALQRDGSALKSLRASALLRMGLALTSENECPLCLTEWENEELKLLLNARLEAAREADASLEGLRRERTDLRARVITLESTMRSLADVLGDIEPATAQTCNELAAALRSEADVLLPDPATGGTIPATERDTRLGAFVSPLAFRLLAETLTKALALPSLSGAQGAWDELTGMENALVECEEALREKDRAALVAKELTAADKLFVASRDAVLQSTYDSIAERLRMLYASVHSDESGFAAEFTPTKAGLNLDVDFYGRGVHPPCALHSEGHQDSMGLCLFLTLTEYLAKGDVPLLVLDDVLMAVDRDHRRAVAQMFKKEFAGCQLIVTTHDRVWWKQLHTVGVVSSRGAIEFKSWSIDDGPVVIADTANMFAEASTALDNKNVPGAAHALRRAVEAYLPDICDALGAQVRFRADAAWEAGDFLGAAMGRYGDLFKKARDAAQSWGDTSTDWDGLDRLARMHSLDLVRKRGP